MKNKKIIYGILVIVALLIIGAILFIILNSTKSSGSVKTMACYDYPNNLSGKHGIPIPCSKDSDCDLSDKNVITNMKKFCSPAEVGFYDCGFKDFCGDDSYCKHDCSLLAE